MPYINNLSYRDISNARVSSRMRQLVVLALVIVIGMLISVSVTPYRTNNKNDENTQATTTTSTTGTLLH